MSRNRLNNGVATAGVGAGVVILWIISAAAGLTLSGWIVMLLLGALHNSVYEGIPALAFFPSVIVALALSVLGSFFRRS